MCKTIRCILNEGGGIFNWGRFKLEKYQASGEIQSAANPGSAPGLFLVGHFQSASPSRTPEPRRLALFDVEG